MDKMLAKPRIESWMSQDKLSFRDDAINNLHSASEMGILPRPISEFGIFPDGDISVVFLVNQQDQPYVVKMVDRTGVIEAESWCYQKWAENGVKTPNVINVHSKDNKLPVSVLVMEYIPAKSLDNVHDTQSRIDNGISYQMGVNLARIHKIKGTGYGEPTSENILVGMYKSLSSLLDEELLREKIPALLSQQLLTQKDLDFVIKAVAVLEKDITNGMTPSLLHNDYGPNNILNTHPLTVIDPGPKLGHPVLCLALPLLKSKARNMELGQIETDEILKGYREITPIEDNIITAGQIIRSIYLIDTWNKKGKPKKVERMLSILREEEKKIVY